MAQSGYTPIKLYASGTAAAQPLAADLALGELALNYTDGKLYYKNGSGTVLSFSGGVTTLSFGTTGLTPSSATAGAIVVAGTLVSGNGGTGFSTYATGDLVYASGVNTLAKLTAGTNGYVLTIAGGVPTWAASSGGVSSFSAGTTGLTPSTVSTGAIVLAGTLAVANGGTGTTTPSIVAGTNITVSGTWPNQTINSSSGVGTVTSVAATVPTFLSVTGSPITSSGTLAISLSGTALPVANGGTGLTTTPANGALDIGNGTGFTRTTLTAGTGVTITNASGSITINATGTGGTVTSVAQSFTGGIISVAGSPITTSGTLALTVAGTSGGVPYFTSTSTWATSALLAANALMIGGGAGVAPSTTTTGTGVVTALGVSVGTAGAFVVNGGVLGTPSSGTLTNATGLPISTGVSGLGTGVATALAVNVGTAGAFVVNGGVLGTPSSGTATNLTGLPLTTGVTGTLPVANGGTNITSYAIGDIIYASTTGILSKLADIATGNALITGGVNTAPSYGKIGLTTHVSGTLPVANGGTGDTTYTDGQLLIGNTTGNTLTKSTLTAGSGITITNSTGSITIASTTVATPIVENVNTISVNTTIAVGNNGFSVGPETINTGVTLTVDANQRYVVF